MKIRIQANRVRLRLSQSEVEQIGNLQPVIMETRFGNDVFIYTLFTHDSAEPILASFSNGEIRISLNSEWAKKWPNSEEVGIQTPTEDSLFVLIEKDFKCLTVREGEDESGLFQNPNTDC